MRSRSSATATRPDLRVESRVVDRDPGVEREDFDDPLVRVGECGRSALVGQVEVADGLTAGGDRDAEERRHRRVIRRKAR